MAITKLYSSVGVYFGTATPPTIAGRAVGEEYYVTSDGTSSGVITERWIYDGSAGWVNTPMSDAEAATTATLIALGEITEDMTGFVDRTSSDYSFVDATRTYTLSPTGTDFLIYHRGTQYTISAPLSIVIDSTPGGRYIHFNPVTQQLEEVLPVGSHPDIKGEALVGYIYWDGSKAIILGDERHSVGRDTQWHYNQHLDVGAIWRDGGVIQYTAKDDSAVNISFSAPIKIADEDLEHTINHSATPTSHYQQILDGSAILPVMYLAGTRYTEVTTGAIPWIHSNNIAVYNQITGGSGSIVQLANSTFVNYWVLFSNDSRNPVKLVLGRAEHSTVAEAEAETFDDYGLSLPEMVIGYKIVCYYKSSYTGNDARIWIEKVLTITGEQNQASVFSTTAHQNLTGTTLDDCHPIESITGLRTELDAVVTTLGELDDTNVASKVDGDVLTWDATASMWVNTAPLTATGTGIYGGSGSLSADTTVDGDDGAGGNYDLNFYNLDRYNLMGRFFVQIASGVHVIGGSDVRMEGTNSVNLLAPTNGEIKFHYGASSTAAGYIFPKVLPNTAGQVIGYNGNDDGVDKFLEWITPPDTLDALTDTNVTTKTDMGALVWDNTAGEWRTSSFAIGKPVFCNVRERFDDANGTSVTCEDEQIFHFDMSQFTAFPGGNLGINATGLNLDPYLATSLTFVCDNSSGSSGIVNTLTIDGNAINLYWQGGVQPVGTVGAQDIVTFSIMRMANSSYKAFGNLVSYA